MSIKKVCRINKGLKGEITIPADKSISHRAVMFASLAKGISTIENFSHGADCMSTLNVLKFLGIEADFKNEKTLIINSSKGLSIPKNDLYCGNSGTTMRLMSGILAGQNFNSVLTGDESLSKRPMDRIIKPLELMGAKIISDENKSPLKIFGNNLAGIDYVSKLSSAQIKSCVLLAGLHAGGKTSFSEPHLSRNHTERMLKYFGANIYQGTNGHHSHKITIEKSELIPQKITVAGDISSAAFFIAAGLIIPYSDIIIKNVGLNPTRTGILDIVEKMGGKIEIIDKKIISNEEAGDLRVEYTGLKGCTIEGEIIPRLIDELPIIAVLATQAEGTTIVKNASDLRNKESDRITAIVSELKKLGANIEEMPDGFKIQGRKSFLKGGVDVKTYHDHRLAMSLYIAGLICNKPVLINGFEWVNISFPEFDTLIDSLI